MDPFNLSDDEFTAVTGLHRVWKKNDWLTHVIRTQAAVIRNLRAERDQNRKGYERKIRRLEKRLAEARQPLSPKCGGKEKT